MGSHDGSAPHRLHQLGSAGHRNIMPRVTELTLPDTADFGVAVNGSDFGLAGRQRRTDLACV